MWEGRKLALETGEPLVVVNRRLRIVHWNQAAQSLLGYSAPEAVGACCYELLGCRRDNRRPGTNCVEQVRKDPDGSVTEHAQRWTKHGRPLWVSLTSVLMRSQRPDLDLLAHIIRDVGHEKERECLIEALAAAAARLVAAAHRPTETHPAVGILTKREHQVLRLLGAGASTEQIATDLDISLATARNHIHHVLSKLGADSRLQAVAFARRDGLSNR